MQEIFKETLTPCAGIIHAVRIISMLICLAAMSVTVIISNIMLLRLAKMGEKK